MPCWNTTIYNNPKSLLGVSELIIQILVKYPNYILKKSITIILDKMPCKYMRRDAAQIQENSC